MQYISQASSSQGLDAPACFSFAVRLPRPSTVWSSAICRINEHLCAKDPVKAKAGFDTGLEMSVQRRVIVLVNANVHTALPAQPRVPAP